jgi:hypothetical protein
MMHRFLIEKLNFLFLSSSNLVWGTTERVPQIPAYTQQNDISLEVTPFERMLVVIAHEGDRFRSFLFTVSNQLSFLQHYRVI